MSFESGKTATADKDETYYDDRAALRELEGRTVSPEEETILEGFRQELGGRALAKDTNHKKLLEKIQQEEQARLAGNDWRLPER